MRPIRINRGADRTLQFNWQNSDGSPMPLTATELFQVDQRLEGRVTLTETNLAAGEFTLNLEGTEPLLPRKYSAWVKVFDNGGDSHSTQVEFDVQ